MIKIKKTKGTSASKTCKRMTLEDLSRSVLAQTKFALRVKKKYGEATKTINFYWHGDAGSIELFAKEILEAEVKTISVNDDLELEVLLDLNCD